MQAYLNKNMENEVVFFQFLCFFKKFSLYLYAYI